jgi:hypothetical protein
MEPHMSQYLQLKMDAIEATARDNIVQLCGELHEWHNHPLGILVDGRLRELANMIDDALGLQVTSGLSIAVGMVQSIAVELMAKKS